MYNRGQYGTPIVLNTLSYQTISLAMLRKGTQSVYSRTGVSRPLDSAASRR